MGVCIPEYDQTSTTNDIIENNQKELRAFRANGWMHESIETPSE